MSEIDRKLEFYPNNNKIKYPYDKSAFWIEFSKWPGEKEEWRLFKRQFIISEEQYNKDFSEYNNDSKSIFHLICGVEGHGWQLAYGLIKDENIVDMETKSFLKYMTDALNEKAIKDKQKVCQNQ